MRSTARSVFVFVLVLTLLLSVGAQAAAGGNSVSFVIDKCIPGNQYAFFVLKGDMIISNPRFDSLYCFDQLKAETAEMQVAVVLPEFAPYDAYVGGVFSNDAASPRKLGSYAPDITTPAQLKEIEASAFEGSAFTHMILGEGVESIGARAFANCEDLTYVFVPCSVKSIASDAFVIGDGEDAPTNPNIVIGCCRGSAAESFAINNGIPYRILD